MLHELPLFLSPLCRLLRPQSWTSLTSYLLFVKGTKVYYRVSLPLRSSFVWRTIAVRVNRDSLVSCPTDLFRCHDAAIESEAIIEELQRRNADLVDSVIAEAGGSSSVRDEGGDEDDDEAEDDSSSQRSASESALGARLRRLARVTQVVSSDLVRVRGEWGTRSGFNAR